MLNHACFTREHLVHLGRKRREADIKETRAEMRYSQFLYSSVFSLVSSHLSFWSFPHALVLISHHPFMPINPPAKADYPIPIPKPQAQYILSSSPGANFRPSFSLPSSRRVVGTLLQANAMHTSSDRKETGHIKVLPNMKSKCSLVIIIACQTIHPAPLFLLFLAIKPTSSCLRRVRVTHSTPQA